MRSLMIMIMLWMLISSFNTFAQTPLEFEIITPENAQDLVEIKSWFKTSSYSFAFNPNSTELAIVSTDQYVEFLSLDSLQTSHILPVSDMGNVDWVIFSSSDNEIVLRNMRDELILLNSQSGEMLARQKTSPDDYLYMIPTPDVRKYKTWNLQNTVTIHDTMTGNALITLENVVRSIVSDDGLLLLTRNTEQILQVWDIESGDMMFEIFPPSHTSSLDAHNYNEGFTPEGLVWVAHSEYIGSGDNTTLSSPIQFWDINLGEIVLTLEGSHYVNGLVFDPTNTYVIAWGLSYPLLNEQCWIWRVTDGEQIDCPADGNGWASFSPDGRLLAIYGGTSPNVNIRQVANEQSLVGFLETEDTYFAEFSPDGRFLVTIDWEKIHLWGIPSE